MPEFASVGLSILGFILGGLSLYVGLQIKVAIAALRVDVLDTVQREYLPRELFTAKIEALEQKVDQIRHVSPRLKGSVA